MNVYFYVFFINFIFSIIDLTTRSKLTKKILLSLIGIIFIIFAGIRWNTGTDWENYLYFYEIVDFQDLGQAGYEFLFEFLQRIIKYFFNDYTAMLVATATIIIVLTYSQLIKFSPYPLLSVLMLYSYSINSSGFGYRQDLAIAVGFFSFSYIYSRRLLPFLFCITIAGFFHTSAFIFLFAYWFYNIKWSRKYFVILILTSFIGYYLSTRLNFISDFFNTRVAGQIDVYLEDTSNTYGDGDNPYVRFVIGFFNRGFLLILSLFIIYKSNDDRIENIKKIYNLVLLGFLIYLILGSISTVFMRFGRYYEIYQIILIPLCLQLVKKENKLSMYLFIILYSLVKFMFVILNADKTYVPYQSIL